MSMRSFSGCTARQHGLFCFELFCFVLFLQGKEKLLTSSHGYW